MNRCPQCSSRSIHYDVKLDECTCLNCGHIWGATAILPVQLSRQWTYEDFTKANKPKPKALGEPVLLMEPIVAWRVWGLCDGGTRLKTRDVWEPLKPLKARHSLGIFPGSKGQWDFSKTDPGCPGSPCVSHEPHKNPGCGIYAFKDPADLLAQRLEHPYGDVLGRVYLWGRIYEHELGYRAEYAYPHSLVQMLHAIDELEGLNQLRKLAATYNVPTDPENAQWKSVNRLASLLRNPSSSPSPYAPGQILPLPKFQQLYQHYIQMLNQPVFQPLPALNPPPPSMIQSPYSWKSIEIDEIEDEDIPEGLMKQLAARVREKEEKIFSGLWRRGIPLPTKGKK